jgi:hypothetical protein
MHKAIKENTTALVWSVLVSFTLYSELAPNAHAQLATDSEKPASPAMMDESVKLAAPEIIMARDPLESPEGMSIYETRALKPRPELLQSLIKSQKLSLSVKTINNVALYQEKPATATGASVTRMALNQQKGHMFWLPDMQSLAKAKSNLLPQEAAYKSAQEFVSKQQLIVEDGSEVAPQKMITRSKTDITPDGKATTVAVLQTVSFQRNLDKKPMMGKGSQLTVDLAKGGQVVGFNRTWNQVVKSSINPEFYSEGDVYNAIEGMVKQRILGASQITVKKPHLIYYGNDGKYVVPAYFFTAVISSPGIAQKSYFAGVVAAAKNSPEAIMPLTKEPEMPLTAQAPAKNQLLNKPVSVAANDPTVGRYVVRDDSSDWVSDANEFKDGLNAGHQGNFPAITFGDYYWDEPSYWTTSDNAYVNKWNIALMEGHGNTWLFTTEKNCCDVVNLNSTSQPGYGNLSGNSMRYLILKGCAIIPAPIDRSDWATPWWRIFKGLHQAVGFRTEMYIDDDISQDFGSYLAQNCQVIDSLFCCTDNCGAYQWERFWGSWGDEIYGYGSAVVIPGYDYDGIYDTGAAPPATSAGLTIWWQH